MASRATSARDAVLGAEKDIEAASQRMVQAAQNAQAEAESRLDALRDRTATVIDDIQAVLTDSDWDKELRLALDLVEDGSTSIQEFTRIWGDAQIDLGEGNQRVSELLSNLDPQVFRRRTQEIQVALREGALELADVVGLIKEQTDVYASSLQNVIQEWEQGRATIDAVIRAAEQARATTGGESTTGALAEGLADILRRTRAEGGR
ncbi:MAG: hypothetical protein AAGD06_27535 [Acidobacteriota bacterium]